MEPSLFRRARPLMIARVLSAAITFAIPVTLARLLAPAEYGTFKQAWLLASTIQLILPLGMTGSLYYFVPREPDRRDAFISQALLVTLASGALGAALLLLGRPLVARTFANPQIDAHLPLIALIAFLLVAGNPLDGAFNSMGRVGMGALVRLGTEASRTAAMLVGALATRSLAGLFWGIAAAVGLRAICTWAMLLREVRFQASWATLRAQLEYALPFALAFLAIIPQQQFHQYAVAASVPAAAFAVYSVATFALPAVDILSAPVSEILQLGIAEKDHRGEPSRALALLREAVSRLSFAFAPCIGVLLVCAPELISFIFTPRYLPAAPLFRLALLSIAFAALPLDAVMRARAQNRFMLAVSVAKLALTVGLVLPGLRLLGPTGAMAGWLAAEGLARSALLWRTAQILGERSLLATLPLADIGRQGAAALLAIAPAWLALHLLPVPLFFRLAACGITYASIYLGALWACGGLRLWPVAGGGAAESAPLEDSSARPLRCGAGSRVHSVRASGSADGRELGGAER